MNANQEAERIIKIFNYLKDRKLQIKCAMFTHLEVLRFMATEDSYDVIKHLEKERASFWNEVNNELTRLWELENPKDLVN